MAVHTSNQAAPARDWLAVTPSDSTNLPSGCRGLYVGATGDLSLLGAGGTSVTFTAVNAGTILPVGPVRVNQTGTTATAIVALY
jgi:hypothetical protein